MIFADSLEALLESIYLEDRITTMRSGNPIYVNPGEKNDYIVGKTIVLTKEYGKDIIGNLRSNMNTIISRVFYPGTIYSPYITRVNFKIQWNGLTVDYPSSVSDPFKWMKEEELTTVRVTDDIVDYIGFPKIIGIGENLLYDSEKNITLLGWALHQVGINVDKKSKYQDLDIIKTRKIVV